MPIMPPRRKVSADNSGVNALISFLGLNDSDPATASMDLVNPAVGMVGRTAKRVISKISDEALSLIVPVRNKADIRKAINKEGSVKAILDSDTGNMFVGPSGKVTHGDIRSAMEKAGMAQGHGSPFTVNSVGGKIIADRHGKAISPNLRENFGLNKFFD